MDIKQENFERISKNRTEKILTLLDQLSNLTNFSFYDYSDEQIETIFKLIEDKTKTVKEKLLDANKKTKRIKL